MYLAELADNVRGGEANACAIELKTTIKIAPAGFADAAEAMLSLII